MSAKQVQSFPSADVLADYDIELLAIFRRLGSRAATVMHDMARIARQKQDVPGLQTQRLAAGRGFQHCRSSDHRVIGDLVRLARPLIDPPRRAIGAAQIEPSAHRHHLEQSAEPVHGKSPERDQILYDREYSRALQTFNVSPRTRTVTP